MTDNGIIRTQEIKTCLLCREEGSPYYDNLPDRLFGVCGTWGFWKCSNCGLVWLNPRPINEDIYKTYSKYLTHDIDGSKSRMEILQEKIAISVLSSIGWYRNEKNETSKRRLFDLLALIIYPFNDIARRYVMNLPGEKRGVLLDVGCGNGKFLADMKKLGWEVEGVEPDTKAAKIASQRFNISVFVGTLQEANYPPNSFDAITLKHVIEHLSDPINLILECNRILKPGGLLSVATPNNQCLQHRLFKQAWMELDPPRHVYLFSLKTLQRLFELTVPNGFQIEDSRTVSVNTAQISIITRSIKKEGKWMLRKLSRWQILNGLLFWFVEEMVKLLSSSAGEEIMMTFKKQTVA